jgi:hypothetical protein
LAPEHVVLLTSTHPGIPLFDRQIPRTAGCANRRPVHDAGVCRLHDPDPAGDGIYLVPEHNPLVLAKTAAIVDRLSRGRFILGVGVGWLAEEFEALGVPFERYGQRTREYIEVMRKLWTERSSSRQGEFANFTDVLSYPKSISEEGIPIWFGGESNPTLRRAVEYGDGWIGFNLLPDPSRRKSNASKNCSGPTGAAAQT